MDDLFWDNKKGIILVLESVLILVLMDDLFWAYSFGLMTKVIAVLILVLMDDLFWDTMYKHRTGFKVESLNPCSNG